MPIALQGAQFPGIAQRSADGFAPPNGLAGTVGGVFAPLTFAASGATNIFLLPRGAVITDLKLIVTTAFNAGTTNTISIGTTASGTAYVNGQGSGTAGIFVSGSPFALGTIYSNTPLAADTQITATYTQSGTAATAGVALITISYIVMPS